MLVDGYGASRNVSREQEAPGTGGGFCQSVAQLARALLQDAGYSGVPERPQVQYVVVDLVHLLQGAEDVLFEGGILGAVQQERGLLDALERGSEGVIEGELVLEEGGLARGVVDGGVEGVCGLGLLDNVVGGCARALNVGLQLLGLGNPAVDVGGGSAA